MTYVNLVVEGEIQKRGFRKYVEGLAEQLSLSGIVYNADNGSVIVSCRGSEDDTEVSIFIEAVERFPSARVTRHEPSAEPYLPKDFSRVVQNYEKEIAERLDEGVIQLRKINEGLHNLTKGQKEMHGDIKEMGGDVKGLREDVNKYFSRQLEFNERLTQAIETIAQRSEPSG